MASSPWCTVTNRFNTEEMQLLEHMSIENLIETLFISDPLVALRVITEIMLHPYDARLSQLLTHPGLQDHWMKYDQDDEVTIDDARFAKTLEELCIYTKQSIKKNSKI